MAPAHSSRATRHMSIYTLSLSAEKTDGCAVWRSRREEPVLVTRVGSARYKYIVAAAFLFGLFMDLMDLTIVNVALPTLGREFHVGNASLEWIVTGYLLSLAIWIPASGWIGDRFGTKKTFLFALGAFTLGSALCGLAQSNDQLIAFRILQGVGGGMMTPVGTAMLFRAFPPQERARAALILTIPTVVAPAVGPILGGWLVDSVSWRWIFFVNLPIGLVGFLFSALFLEEHTEETAGSFDAWGFVLSGVGLASILYALSRGPEDGWAAPNVLVTGIGGILSFIALVAVELRKREPMLHLRLFTDRMFRTANIVFFAAMGSLIGVLFLLPLFLQQLRGFSAIETGLILFPQAIGVIVFAQISGRLYPIVGPRRLLATALALFAISSALMLFIDLETSVWWIVAILFIRGIAMAFTFIPLQAATFSTISVESTGRASSLFNTNRQVGASFGVAILATVLVERTQARMADAAGSVAPAAQQAAAQHASLLAFHDTFFAAVILGIIGFAFAFLIHDEDAAASMRQAHAVPAGEAVH
jgi:EmrB/QacA subfamily drug resistance transporter